MNKRWIVFVVVFFTVINMDNLIAKGDCEQQVILESARYSHMDDINVIDIINGLLPANDGNWYYYVDGNIDYNFNDVVENPYGWWYVEHGKVRFNFNGVAQNLYGNWLIKNGKVDFSNSGVLQVNSKSFFRDNCNSYDGWYNFVNGKIIKNKTVAQNVNGWWFVDDNGKVDFLYNGIANNKNGNWVINNGKVNFNYNGLIYDNGVGYYCKNGRVCEDVTNIINIDGEWYYVIKGIVYNSNDPIVAKNENGWWYVGTNGKVDFNYEGVAQNKNGWWYLKNGKVDFDKKMIFTDPKTGINYNIINGKATIIKQKDEWELPVM